MKNRIAETLQQALRDLYQIEWQAEPSIMQNTKKEFEGDFTLVVFPFVKAARKAPDVVATELGNYFAERTGCEFNVVKGFLNLSFPDKVWTDFLRLNRCRVTVKLHLWFTAVYIRQTVRIIRH